MPGLAAMKSCPWLSLDESFEYHMPAEWEEHSACLILFPHNPETFRVEKARREIIDLALAISTVGQESVYLLCRDDQNVQEATSCILAWLEDETRQNPKTTITTSSTDSHRGCVDDTYTGLPVCTAICPSNDTWARDTGPTFVFRRQKRPEVPKKADAAGTSYDTAATESKTTAQKGQQTQELIGLDWEFNAYGGPEEGCYWPCNDDQAIASLVCSKKSFAKTVVGRKKGMENDTGVSDREASDSIGNVLSIHSSLSIPMILEGGSFHTDGEGTLLTTSECLLNPNRNPHLTKEQIEKVLKNSLGVSKVLWLPYGLDADVDTNGHVDNFCCFVRPGHVVLAWTDHDTYEDDENSETPSMNNYKRCRAAYEYLKSIRDAKGRAIEITKLYLPVSSLRYTEEEALSIGNKEKQDDHTTAFVRYPNERMAASYINFYIANKAILVPQFACGVVCDLSGTQESLALADRKAIETLESLFPGRTVVGVPSREILLGGGNIHCQTQQVPLAGVKRVT